MRRFTFTREAYIPKGSCKVADKLGLGVVYVYTMPGTDRLAAAAFIGKQSKPVWHFTFKDAAAREKRVREFFEGLAKNQASKAESRAKRNQPHTLKLGAVIVNSWGYDQTNVDWYCVVGVTAHFVTLRRIAAELVGNAGKVAPMAGYSTAHIDVSNPDPSTWGVRFLRDETTKHKASSFDGRNSVTMKFGSGQEWDGRPMYESWYA